MTISSQTNKTVIAMSTVGQTSFPYTFKILDDGDISVSSYNLITGASTNYFTYEYAVTGVGNDAGGNVVFTDSPVSSIEEGRYLVIKRNLPLTQETDYVEYDAFPAQSHENALDKLTMIAQQLKNDADQSIRLNDALTNFDPVIKQTPVAGAVLSIDASGNGFEFKASADTGAYLFPTGNGLLAQTDENTATARAIESGDINIMVTNGDGVSGNPTIKLAPIIATDTLLSKTADANLVLVGNGNGIVDVQDNLKVSGIIDVAGTSDAAAQLSLFEQTTNGTNKITFVAPASLTANRTITLPDANITLGNVGLDALTVYMNSNQTFSTTLTKLAFNAVYSSGTTTGMSSSWNTTTYRFTAPKAGTYLVLIHMNINTPATSGTGYIGATINGGSNFMANLTYPLVNPAGTSPSVSGSFILTMTTSDYFELYGMSNTATWQAYGGAYPSTAVTGISHINIVRIA